MRFLILLLTPLLVFAENPDEAVVGSDNIFSARALGMAGAATALSNDYSAVYWNPASLAGIKRKEVHFSLGYFSKQSSTDNLSAGGESQISMIKLQSAGLVYPFPTVQGSFVVALGYSRPKIFLDAFQLKSLVVPNYTLAGNSDGHLSNWDLAAAVDLSEKISCGGKIAFVTGLEDYADSSTGLALDTSTILQDDYAGFTGSLGLLIRLAGPWTAGVNLSLVNYVSIDRRYTEETDSAIVSYAPFNTRMNLPARISAGIAYTTVPISFDLDFEISNWADFKFEEDGVLRYANQLQNTYRAGLGAEWLIPGVPVKLRGGIGYQTEPLASPKLDGPPLFYTGGMGFLFDRVLAVDLAGRYDQRVYTNATIVTATQALLTAAYRF